MPKQIQKTDNRKTYEPFHPPARLPLGPGPSPVDERVLQAMTAPVLGHLDPIFLQCMTDIQELLRYVFETENRVTIPVSATGSGGMEAALVNAIEPGDEVIVCVHGVFSDRMLQIVERTGARPVILRREWGEAFELDQIADAFKTGKPRVLAMVHAETSTGVLQDLAGFAELAHAHDALFVVDTVASLGGQSVGVDRHQIDVCYSGSQKCLSAPPGLAPITFSERAIERLRARTMKVQSWYFDIAMIERYWGEERTYHHTAPISMNYALREALRLIYEEGLEACWQRHELNHRALVAGVEAMGLRLRVPEARRAWAVNVVCVPEGVEDGRIRGRLLNDFNIEIAGGLGPLKGKIWRIGLMGSGSRRANVLRLLEALHTALQAEGYSCPSGEEAAERVYEG